MSTDPRRHPRRRGFGFSSGRRSGTPALERLAPQELAGPPGSELLVHCGHIAEEAGRPLEGFLLLIHSRQELGRPFLQGQSSFTRCIRADALIMIRDSSAFDIHGCVHLSYAYFAGVRNKRISSAQPRIKSCEAPDSGPFSHGMEPMRAHRTSSAQ